MSKQLVEVIRRDGSNVYTNVTQAVAQGSNLYMTTGAKTIIVPLTVDVVEVIVDEMPKVN